MIKNIDLSKTPKYILHGIKPTVRGCQKAKFLVGGDTETFNGYPLTLQFCDELLREKLIFVDKDNVMDRFLDYFRNLELKDGCKTIYCYFHVLSYDLTILLYPIYSKLQKYSRFEHEYQDAKISVLCSKLYYAKIRYFKGKTLLRTVFILDSWAFTHGSLDRISKEVDLPVKKMKRPDLLGEVKYTIKDSYFCEYALNDAKTEYYLANWIYEMHKFFDVPISVSIAQFSQRIFTKNFLCKKIPYPPESVVKASLLSYHGGKNAFYLDKAQKVPEVYELDVNSMYPNTMANLPGITSGWFEFVDKFDYEHIGVYCVSGFVEKRMYQIICGHDFKYINGFIKDIWICSYEILEALKDGSLRISEIHGYVWIPEETAHNPLKDFVNHFYKLKSETPKNDNKYMIYKLILNSLTGKLIQNIEIPKKSLDKKNDERQDHEVDIYYDENNPEKEDIIEVQRSFKPGGIFNPFIATCITSAARAHIYRIEKAYKSLDTSTDSVKTIENPNPSDLSTKLGDLSISAYGDTIFFRNKLYIMFNELETKDYSGKAEIKLKYALHGFGGSVSQLLKMYLNRERTYKYIRILKVREALHRKQRPLIQIEIPNAQLRNIEYQTEYEDYNMELNEKYKTTKTIFEEVESDQFDWTHEIDWRLNKHEIKEELKRKWKDYAGFYE